MGRYYLVVGLRRQRKEWGRLPFMAKARAGFIGWVVAFTTVSRTAAATRQGTPKAIRKKFTGKENKTFEQNVDNIMRKSDISLALPLSPVAGQS